MSSLDEMRRMRKRRQRRQAVRAGKLRDGSIVDLAVRAARQLRPGSTFTRKDLAAVVHRLGRSEGRFAERSIESVSQSLSTPIEVLTARGLIHAARERSCRIEMLYGLGAGPADGKLLPAPRPACGLARAAAGSARQRMTFEQYEQQRLMEHRRRRLAGEST